MLLTLCVIVIFGLLLLVVETFVPGGILGTLGVLCVLFAVALTLTSEELVGWSTTQRVLAAAGIVIFSGLVMITWLKWFAVKLFKKTFTLESAISSGPDPKQALLGLTGHALTELRPLGRVELDNGERHEVRSWSGSIAAGERIEVIRLEPGNLVVRLAPPAASA
ncbi:MAG: hypothetical protein KDK99_17680 [Verrucomicrobiales bacterium]|nr:hypothetical protein [Verrucomicrobiales bacterium]